MSDQPRQPMSTGYILKRTLERKFREMTGMAGNAARKIEGRRSVVAEEVRRAERGAP